MKRLLATVIVGALAATALAGCSSAASGDTVVKVAYQTFGAFTQMDTHMKAVKKEYEANNKGVTVKLVPIAASENDYYTKLALMNRSASTAPDVLYEDTFLIKSDAEAGYLAPLDAYVAKWKDWQQFPDNAKKAGQGVDNKLYGISMGTDTRALWYNKGLLEKAGVAVPWQPKTWKDLLDAAKKVKAAEPGVVPFNVYSGKPQGEAAVMQGFEMLLSPELQPAAVSIFAFFGQYGAVVYGQLAAFSLVYSVPVLALYVFTSRVLGGGSALAGAVKG